MKFADAVTSIKGQIAAAWAVSHSDIPLIYTNEPTPTFDQATRIVHIEIRAGAQRIASWGGQSNNRYRQSGEVIMRIFGPSEEGEDVARGLADDAAAILLGYRDGDLVFTDSAPAGGAATDENGNFFEADVIASFFVDLIG
jgi:hypothetical protein